MVFLRELLQNSLDAIRSRRLLLDRNGIPGFNELVSVQVTVAESGRPQIEWSDNGMGMDLYVIENFFAVAGRNYYTSRAFLKQNLPFDPIAKFGIGVLSCFAVTSSIEIKTFKEPHAGGDTTPLSVSVTDINKTFRVESLCARDARPEEWAACTCFLF